MEPYRHKSVLLEAALDALCVKPDGVYVDGTAGGGGHADAIARRLEGGRLLALDIDPEAVRATEERLKPYGAKAKVLCANYRDIAVVLKAEKIEAVDGILLDLGVSSHQLDTPSRGFSYLYDAPLDMRMGKTGQTAADLVNSASRDRLIEILREYGEERYATSIASHIVREREKEPIQTTRALARVIAGSVPAAARRKGNPSRKTFQALRIAVNGELDSLKALLDEALPLLKPGGRIVILTFHSLEDRIVKRRFLLWAKPCTCPPDAPVCTCGHTPEVRILYKRGIVPTPEEVADNPRSRSARLRAAEKLDSAAQTAGAKAQATEDIATEEGNAV